MLQYDPNSNLTHYPVTGGMARFGLNPYGKPLFRVVFARSRRHLVAGEWPDGSNCAKWVVKHESLTRHFDSEFGVWEGRDLWIMERWLSAEDFAKCTKDEWVRDYLVLGPWPEKGEYELCHVFDPAPPADASIEELITRIEYGRRIPFGDTLQFHRQDAAREKLATRATAEAMIRNRLPAWGSVPFVGGRGHRGSKTAPMLRTAQELGLPTRPGLISNGARENNPVTRMIESAG